MIGADTVDEDGERRKRCLKVTIISNATEV